MLDVGCRMGYTAVYFARLGYEVDALDIDPEPLAQLEAQATQENLPITVHQADMYKWQPSTEYDLVVMDKSIYFLQPQQIFPTVKKYQAVTKLGGLHATSIWSDENPGESPRYKMGKYGLYNMYPVPEWNILQRWRPTNDSGQIFYAVTAQRVA